MGHGSQKMPGALTFPPLTPQYVQETPKKGPGKAHNLHTLAAVSDLRLDSTSSLALRSAALQHFQTSTECCLEFARGLLNVSWAGLGQLIPY